MHLTDENFDIFDCRYIMSGKLKFTALVQVLVKIMF